MFHNTVMILLLVLSICALLTLVYIVTARHFEDRVVGSNLVGTIVINFVAVLAVYFEEGFVVDVCLVFAFLSFLGVIVLCRLLVLQNLERELKAQARRKKKKEGEQS